VFKNLVLLVALLIASRFIGLPANFSPLLALAVFMPRLTDDKRLQYLLPVGIIALSNLFLEPVNWIILATMLTVFAVTPTVSRRTKSLFWGSVSAIGVWHVAVNGSVWLVSGGSLLETYLAAIPFDFKLAVSTGLYVALFHYAENIYKLVSGANSKILDRLV
tara:strand:+ start:675 stop:1160 length:486 start_codon:yes stop_codon:yes gene_type:complete